MMDGMGRWKSVKNGKSGATMDVFCEKTVPILKFEIYVYIKYINNVLPLS
jgi:hypothetical protein